MYADGACRRNGQLGAAAGYGVYWGPNDPRYGRAEGCACGPMSIAAHGRLPARRLHGRREPPPAGPLQTSGPSCKRPSQRSSAGGGDAEPLEVARTARTRSKRIIDWLPKWGARHEGVDRRRRQEPRPHRRRSSWSRRTASASNRGHAGDRQRDGGPAGVPGRGAARCQPAAAPPPPPRVVAAGGVHRQNNMSERAAARSSCCCCCCCCCCDDRRSDNATAPVIAVASAPWRRRSGRRPPAEQEGRRLVRSACAVPTSRASWRSSSRTVSTRCATGRRNDAPKPMPAALSPPRRQLSRRRRIASRST